MWPARDTSALYTLWIFSHCHRRVTVWNVAADAASSVAVAVAATDAAVVADE